MFFSSISPSSPGFFWLRWSSMISIVVIIFCIPLPLPLLLFLLLRLLLFLLHLLLLLLFSFFLLFFFSLLSFYYYSYHSNYYSWSSWSIIYTTDVAECKLVACALSSISYAPPPLANRRANLPFFDTTRETQNEACLQKQECDRIMSVGLPQTFRKVQQGVARGEHAWSS